jgi:hypothetical protein
LDQERSFVGVHNLHQSDRFHADFKRIPPTEKDLENLKAQLGSTAENDWFRYEGTDKDGVQQVKLNVKLKQIKNAPVSRSRAESDFKAYQEGYNALHKDLKDAMDSAVSNAKKETTFFQRLFGNATDLNKLKESEELNLSGRDDSSSREIKVLTKNSQHTDKVVTLENVGDGKVYNDKSGLKKRLFITGAVVGVVGLIVGSSLTGGILGFVLGGIAGAGLISMGGKALFGKAPWWDKTAIGQRQHMERKQARSVADAIRDEVKNFSLQAITTTEGKQKREVFNDKAMLTDFVKLAAQNNADDLLAKVKEAVRDPENQILSKETLKRLHFKKDMSMLVNLGLRNPSADAKSWKFDWGNRVKHAEKTADIVAYEIARGIMAGVQEAVLQSEVGALSDKRTVEGQNIVLDIVGQKNEGDLPEGYEGPAIKPKGFKAFQNAVTFLTPSEEASDSDLQATTAKIYETDERLKELQQVSGTIMPLIGELKEKKSDIGSENVQQYTERLQKLEGDLSVHMASLLGVDELITGSRVPEAVHLNQILTGKDEESGYTNLFTEGFEKNGAEVKKTIEQLKEKIQELRNRIADEDDMTSSLLVEGQARALVALVGQVEKCIDTVGERSSKVAASRDVFKSEFTLEQLQGEKTNLANLQTSEAGVDYDPTKKIGEIITAIKGFDTNLINLLELCKNVETASERLKSYESLETDLRRLADNGDLKSALDPEKLANLDNYFKDQQTHLQDWQGAGYKIPSNLTQLTQERLNALKLELTARALGVSELENQKALAPILGKLADVSHSEAVAILKALPSDTKIDVLQKLQNLMGEEPQQALDSYIILKESVKNPEDAKSVNAVLHAGQMDLINKFEDFSTAEENLRKLFDRSSLQPDVSFGEQLRSHLLDGTNASANTIGEKNTGYSARAFLHMLSAFASDSKDEKLANAANLTDGIARLLPTEETKSWIRNAESFNNLSTDDLSRLATLAEQLSDDEGFAQSVETRFKNEQSRVQGQFIAEITAEKIAGVPRPEVSQIQENVQKASSLKNPQDKTDFDNLLKEINALLEQQKTLQRDGTLSEEDITKNLESLATALKWKAHKNPQINLQMLKERLQTNNDVAQHFSAVLGLSAALEAAQGIGPVNHEFAPKELLEGARAIPNAIRHISPTDLSQLPEPLQQTRSQREKVEKAISEKSDEKIQSLLKNNKKGVTDYVKTFQQENRFIQEIKHRTSNSGQSDAAFRQQLEGAYDTQDNANKNLAGKRATNLSGANLNLIKESLKNTWTLQTNVLKGLLDTSKTKAATGYYSAQLAQLQENIQVLDAINEITLGEPGSPNFAVLGKMLLDADRFTDLNAQPGDKVKHAYMKGQFELSRNAIKYLNPKTLDAARPGLIGRFIHRLFNRGERINRILRDSQKAQDIAEWIISINKGVVLDESQKAQLEAVNQSLETMFATRDSLVKDPNKVELAYQFLAAQHLSNAGAEATLSKADINFIKDQWKALLADDTKDAFLDIEDKIDNLRGKGLKELQANLSTKEAKDVASAVDRLLQEQNVFLDGVAEFKQRLDDLRFGRLNFSDNTQAAKLKATIRDVGLEYEDYEAIQALDGKGVSLQGILDQFRLANSEIKSLSNETTTAVFRATQAKLKLEQTIAANKDNLTSDDIKNLESISRILEESFLERVGPSAPKRLESHQDFAEIMAFQAQLDAYYKNPTTPDELDSLEPRMEALATKYNESKLLENLQDNTAHVPVHLLDSLAQARYQIARIYRDADKATLSEAEKNVYSSKYAAHAYTAAFAIKELSNFENDKSIPSSLGNELKFRFAQGPTVNVRLPAILTTMGLNSKHTFTVVEMNQRIVDAKAEEANQKDEGIDLGDENQSQVSYDYDSDSESTKIRHQQEMKAELDATQEAPINKQNGGFLSNIFGGGSKKKEPKPIEQKQVQLQSVSKKVPFQSDKLMSKLATNPKVPAPTIKNTVPIQQMAPAPATAKEYWAKIEKDNKKLHEYLQKAQQPPAQTSVQAKSPQVQIPAFQAKGENTLIDRNNMGELQKIDSLKDYLSPAGAKYQQTLQTMNGFRKAQGFQPITDPAEYFIEQKVAQVRRDISSVFDVILPVNERPVLDPLQALASIGRSAVSIQDNGQCFYLSVASAQGKKAVLGTGEDVSNNAKSTRQALLSEFGKLDGSGMKFVTGVSEESKLPASLNKVFKTLTTGLDGERVNLEGWGGPEEARLAAMAYNRPVVSIRSEGIVISYPNKTEETCTSEQLQGKLSQIQQQNPMILILKNDHWQNTIPQQ